MAKKPPFTAAFASAMENMEPAGSKDVMMKGKMPMKGAMSNNSSKGKTMAKGTKKGGKKGC